MSGLIPFGRFGRPHGVRGELRFWAYNPNSPLLAKGRAVRIGADAEGSREVQLSKIRFDAKSAVVRLEGVDSREAAEALNGTLWFETREAFGPIGEGEHYVVDLIGLQVSTEEGRELGRIDDVLQVGAADVLVIKGGRKKYMVPHVEDFVRSIDMQARQVIISPIEGLLEE